MIGEDAAYAGFVHQPKLVDVAFQVPNRHLDSRSVRIRVQPRPEVSRHRDGIPCFKVGIRPLVASIGMRPVGEVTVLNRREGHDQVVGQLPAVGQHGRLLSLTAPVSECLDEDTGMLRLQMGTELQNVVEHRTALALILFLHRETVRAVAELTRDVIGIDGDDLVVGHGFDVPQHVGSQFPAQRRIAEAQLLIRHALAVRSQREEFRSGLEIVRPWEPGKVASELAGVGRRRNVSEQAMHELVVEQVWHERRRRVSAPSLGGHVHAVLEVELLAAVERQFAAREGKAALPMEVAQSHTGFRGNDGLLENGVPAPAQRVLQKLHDGVQVAVDALAIQEHVASPAQRDMFLVLQCLQRIAPQPLDDGRTDTNKQATAPFTHRLCFHHGKLRAGDLLQVIRESCDGITVHFR